MYINFNDFELLYLVKEGSEKAKTLLFDKYSTLIKKIYREGFYYQRYHYSDFLQEGLMVLENVVCNYKNHYEVTFYNYFKICFARRLKRINSQNDLRICEKVVKYRVTDIKDINDNKLRHILEKECEKEPEIIKKILNECVIGNYSLNRFCEENNLNYRKIYYLYTKMRLKLEKILTK